MTTYTLLKKAFAVIVIAAVGFTANAQTAAGLKGNTGIGIAAGFPGDVGIENHPDVIRAENFEGYNAWRDLLRDGRWSVTNGENPAPEGVHVHFSKENKVTGTQSLQLDLYSMNTPRHTGINLDLNEAQKQDVIYVRYYHKIDKSYHVPPGVSNHNGAYISSKYWSSGPQHIGPGKAATGTNKYLVQLENTASTGYDGYSMKAYIYHPEQRYNYEGYVPIPGMPSMDPGEPWTSAYTHRPGQQYGDAFYPDGEVMPWNHWRGDYGEEFIPRSKFFVEFDRWYCYELMLKANTPGQRDGRLTAWIDGEIIMDFPNMRWRDIDDLKIDQVGFSFGADRISAKTNAWYDNIVIATSYIGPINFGSEPIAPPVPPDPDPKESFRVRLTARESIGDAGNPPFRGAPVTVTGNGTYTATVYTMEYGSFTGLALESETGVPAGWEDAAITFDKVMIKGVPSPETKQGNVNLIDVSLENTRGSAALVGANGGVNALLWNGIQPPFQNHLTGITEDINRGHTGFAVPGITKITAIEVTFTVTGGPVSILTHERVIPGSGFTKAEPSFQFLESFLNAGPNPAARSSGEINFFWQGKRIESAALTVFNAQGNVVRRLQIKETKDAKDNNGRRIIGSWDLTDRKGRVVSEGTYLVRGTITVDGKKERVSLMVGVK